MRWPWAPEAEQEQRMRLDRAQARQVRRRLAILVGRAERVMNEIEQALNEGPALGGEPNGRRPAG